jgi:hypothetical protein
LNPTGTLDFYYEVANDPNSVTAISRESDTSFLGFETPTRPLAPASGWLQRLDDM